MTLKRRAHRKSRSGCNTCKQRRIKCDEVKPKCSHCVRHDVACVYPTGQDSQRTPQNTSHHSSPLQTTPGDASQHVSPGAAPVVLVLGTHDGNIRSTFEMHDMALLHHWTLTTSLTIANSPAVDHYWQKMIPTLGFQHKYVMNALLSLAALHMAYCNPSDQRLHVRTAAHHHTQALAGLREDINAIGPENATAIFTASHLIFFYAFLAFGKLYDSEGEEDDNAARTSRALGSDWMPLVRGFFVVTRPILQFVKDGPLSAMLGLSHWDDVHPDTYPSRDDEYLLRLRDTWQSDKNAEVYNETLQVLRQTASWLAYYQSSSPEVQETWSFNREGSAPFVWFSLSPEEYFVLQRQRQPQALLIFAFFGVLLQRLDKLWWTEGCGKSIVQAVDDCLGSYWRPWMEWPRHVVGLD